jgi:hypothetical protein
MPLSGDGAIRGVTSPAVPRHFERRASGSVTRAATRARFQRLRGRLRPKRIVAHRAARLRALRMRRVVKRYRTALRLENHLAGRVALLKGHRAVHQHGRHEPLGDESHRERNDNAMTRRAGKQAHSLEATVAGRPRGAPLVPFAYAGSGGVDRTSSEREHAKDHAGGRHQH